MTTHEPQPNDYRWGFAINLAITLLILLLVATAGHAASPFNVQTVNGALTKSFTVPTGTSITATGSGSIAATTVSSSWAGSTGITTLGTISTGTWNGSLLTGQYGGTGVANTGKTLTLGGSYTINGTSGSTLNISTGGTLGTGAFQPQTVLTGTANQISVSNSGVGATTVSIPADVILANNPSITLPNGTSSSSSIKLWQGANTAGGNRNIVLGNSAFGGSFSTTTESTVIGHQSMSMSAAANSVLVGNFAGASIGSNATSGATMIGRGTGGNLYGNFNTVVGFSAANGTNNKAGEKNSIFGASAAGSVAGSYNTILGYNAAATLDTGGHNTVIGDGVDVPSLGVSNYVVLGSNSVARATFDGTDWAIASTTEATTGGAGSFQLAGGFYAAKKIVGNSDIIAGGITQLKAYIVSGLPSAASYAGGMAYVTDANATTRLSTVAGGGANKVIVFSDGTNWLIL